MPKKYTSGELFGAAVPSDIKDIFKKKEKEKYIEDVLSKKDADNFTKSVDELNFAVEENYPLEDIMGYLESMNYFRQKIKKVL
jgi:hypothetical protein